ncbi:PREDICTED: uncharacterized protein LOC108974061 [Bactrocera latifrons]|uniref:Uncharacterized protein n=2 Tax=Bactrocera latifrons TaxID=174628 RepID=A0A0K8V2I2_BACLA|nr:PREDICTED: uncharacterized protein LOC108974061 [Bactrocera latifrons]XP_018797221.1 PREDICTED: uncharacterized protein LOC108974061 [Bactrocera latifrons]
MVIGINRGIVPQVASIAMPTEDQRPNNLAKMSHTFHPKQKTITTVIPTSTTCNGKYENQQHRQRSSIAHNRKHAPQRQRPSRGTCPTHKSNVFSNSAQVRMLWMAQLFTVAAFLMCHSMAIVNATAVQTPHALSRGVINTDSDTAGHRAMRAAQYSQPLTVERGMYNADINSFLPIIPKDISPEYIAQNVFTKGGQYRVFEPTDSDLRTQMTMGQKVNRVDGVEVNANAQNNVSLVVDISRATDENIKTTAEGAMVAKLKEQTNSKQETEEKATLSLSAGKNEKPLKQSEQALHKVGASTNISAPATATFMIHKSKALPNSFNVEQLALEERKIARGHKENFKPHPTTTTDFADVSQNTVGGDIKELEALLFEYAENFFNKAQYEPSSELVNALQQNHTMVGDPHKERPTRHADANPHHHHHNHLHHRQHSLPAIVRKPDANVSVNIPRALESGRLLFFSGLKKALWPVYIGLQVLKSLLLALFMPVLIGSFSKFLGKGIVSGSAPLFIRPPDTPQDLDFRDNTINFDDDKFAAVEEGTKEDGYGYNQAEASQTHYTYNAAGGINRIEQQNKMPDTYLSALQTIGSASFKNSGSLSGSFSGGGLGGGGIGAPMRTKPIAPANTNTFQTFQKVPASSLLLSNYDPFYSPLLSRLDSVFAQLKINSDNENCREKLICLMYANPAKYAPYSNLVSAQLSRELNELRKPTSDNPDILRFFKYMRAAKDGQDGIDCEKSFDRCQEFKDFENPAMVSTYHDINKLVSARKLA